jgi:uncharacterized membrane protein YqiK
MDPTSFNLIYAAILAATVIVALFTIGTILARLYRRSTKERAFVRTGLGGQRVIMDGGALVFPVLHEIIAVNMNTLRLEVKRAEEGALITRDRMRVDVTAEFYVRVKPTIEAIADAAQTLGRRTENPEELKQLVEGKFVDSLRAVAAEMSMEQLHEHRVQFVQKVQAAVSEDLLKNGLELETVSLTSLNQTDREYFNPNNAFDAEGLTKLTEAIEARRKRRNDIEQDTAVMIQQKDLAAEREKLGIAREVEYARLEQQREIEVRRAHQVATIALEQAEQRRTAEQARIVAEQQVAQARIEAERLVEEQRIGKERQIRERDIERLRATETAEVQKQEAVALADQARQIAVANKSREQSVAEAEADRARAQAVEAEQAVITVRESASAEREKIIQLIDARKDAEREAIGVTVAAEAQRQAANDQAEAAKTLAEGEAAKLRIAAQGEADAERLRAEAARVRYSVDADGRRALHEADNVLSVDMIAMRIKLALIENLDRIIRESVKPIEAIDGIKIIQVDGLGVGGPAAAGGAAANGHGSGNLAEQAVSAALRYRAQAPLLDSLLGEIGLQGGDLRGLTGVLGAQAPAPAAPHHAGAEIAPPPAVPALTNGESAV